MGEHVFSLRKVEFDLKSLPTRRRSISTCRRTEGETKDVTAEVDSAAAVLSLTQSTCYQGHGDRVTDLCQGSGHQPQGRRDDGKGGRPAKISQIIYQSQDNKGAYVAVSFFLRVFWFWLELPSG